MCGDANGCDLDQPPNLAKSVTVVAPRQNWEDFSRANAPIQRFSELKQPVKPS
jgi:hypothetical protein